MVVVEEFSWGWGGGLVGAVVVFSWVVVVFSWVVEVFSGAGSV